MSIRNRFFAANNPGTGRVARLSSHRKIRRRQLGTIENLERREMMAADSGALRPLPLAPIQSDFVRASTFAPAARNSAAPSVVTTTDNTMATAQDLGTLPGSRTISGSVGPTDTNDFYRFT